MNDTIINNKVKTYINNMRKKEKDINYLLYQLIRIMITHEIKNE